MLSSPTPLPRSQGRRAWQGEPSPRTGVGPPPANTDRLVQSGAFKVTCVEFDLCEPEEVARALAPLYPGVTVEGLPNVPFSCVMRGVQVGPLALLRGAWRGGARLTSGALGDRYVVGIATENRLDRDHMGRHFVALPGRRALVAIPGQRVSMQASRGAVGESLSINRAALEAHFVVLTGRELRAPLSFKPELDLTTGAGAAVLALSGLLRREVQEPDVSPLLLASLTEALFTTLLTGPAHDHARWAEPLRGRVAPASVRRAEAFIAAHATEPVTLADIVQAAGVPARALQIAFQSARGTTPMGFLRERRFEAARQRLLTAAPGTRVAEIACLLGFGRAVGRFATEYRKRFGESPSETLAKTRIR